MMVNNSPLNSTRQGLAPVPLEQKTWKMTLEPIMGSSKRSSGFWMALWSRSNQGNRELLLESQATLSLSPAIVSKSDQVLVAQ